MKIKAATRLLADTVGPLANTDYWKKRGAGCIVMARSTNRFLFPLRSSEVSDPNTWGTWGGSVDGSDEPSATVRRELHEEADYHGLLDLYPLLTFRDPDRGSVYQNYLAIVPEEFEPRLNWETAATIWTEFGNWPTPAHPGLEMLLCDAPSLSTIRYHMNEE